MQADEGDEIDNRCWDFYNIYNRNGMESAVAEFDMTDTTGLG